MTADQILNVLKEKGISFSVQSLNTYTPIEKVVIEPKDIDLYHEGAICICGPDYYDTIKGQHNNILYFLLNVEKERPLSPAANMVFIHEDISFTELFHIVDDYIHRNYRISDAYSQIGMYILSGKSLEQLLEIGSKLIKNPIALLDISTKALCYSSIEEFEKLDDELMQSVVKNGFVPSNLFKKYDYETLLPFIGSMEKSQIFYSKFDEKLNRITARVMVNNKYFGMLVIPEIWTTFTEDDPAIADIIANGVSILLEKQKVGTVNSNTENIFMELLADSFSNEKEFKERTGGFSWEPCFPIRIVAIKTRNEKQSQSLLSFRNHLSLILPKMISAYYQETMFLLVEEASRAYVANTLSTFLQSNDLLAGVSIDFEGSLSIAHYARQAKDILRIGKFLYPKEHIFQFENHMLHYNAFIIKKNHCEESFLFPEFRKACEYDEEYDTNYCASVREWLNHRNLIRAAEALNIHRNTMVYRLEKFEAITGLSLSSGDAIYRLNTAFHLWDLRDFEVEE